MARRRSSSIPWLVRYTKPGTVYLLISRDQPGLSKVGYTGRLSRERRRELELQSGEQLIIAFTMSTPWTYAIKHRLHRFYRRRLRGSARKLGTEWSRLRRWEGLEGVRRRMVRIAKNHRVGGQSQTVLVEALRSPVLQQCSCVRSRHPNTG